MQKLEKRNTYTPTHISQVRSNCDQLLKTMGKSGGVTGLKTFSNNSDATLTNNKGQLGQNMCVSVVYVLNMRGKPLMPCSPRKAKQLLKKGEAVIKQRTPFTIQLTR